MKKLECIEYINIIRPYINLNAVCKLYNQLYPENPVDYNNLRSVLNGFSLSRLSEDKLNFFIQFLFEDLYINIFNDSSLLKINENKMNKIIDDNANKLKTALKELF